MPVREVTTSEFAKEVTDCALAIVDFWAPWCQPCIRFAPVFMAAAERHPQVNFFKVDTEAEFELAAEAGITSIPTVMAFREGIVVYNQAGALDAQGLDQVIELVQQMDMDEVRRHLAADQD